MKIAAFLVPLIPNVWALPIFVFLLYVTVALELTRGSRAKRHLERVDLIVLIFLIFCSLSFLNMDLTFRSPQNYLRYYLGTYLFPILAYFAFRLIRFSDERARGLREVVLASGVIFSLCCIYEFAFSHPLALEFDNPDQWMGANILRAGTLAGGSVHAGETMTGFIALTMPFIFFRWPGRSSFNLILLLLIELMGLGVILSRAGYVATLSCAVAAFLFLRGRYQRRLVAISMVLLLFLLAAPALTLPDWLYDRLTAVDSSLARLPRFWAGIDFIRDNLHLGWQTALLGKGYIASYLWGLNYLQSSSGIPQSSDAILSGGFHNGYLTMITDQGLVAFGCYLTLVVAALRRLWRYCRPLRRLETPKLMSPALLEPVGWGLIIIAHLVTETVHWSFGFPQMFYFFMALAMLFNLTSADRIAKADKALQGVHLASPQFAGSGPAAALRQGRWNELAPPKSVPDWPGPEATHPEGRPE
jgi:hypothetical protein